MDGDAASVPDMSIVIGLVVSASDVCANVIAQKTIVAGCLGGDGHG